MYNLRYSIPGCSLPSGTLRWHLQPAHSPGPWDGPSTPGWLSARSGPAERSPRFGEWMLAFRARRDKAGGLLAISSHRQLGEFTVHKQPQPGKRDPAGWKLPSTSRGCGHAGSPGRASNIPNRRGPKRISS